MPAVPLIVADPPAGFVKVGAVLELAGAMLNVIVAFAVPALFVARKVTAVPPVGVAAVGVPVIAPVLALNVRPAGNVPLKTDKVGVGVPLAASA